MLSSRDLSTALIWHVISPSKAGNSELYSYDLADINKDVAKLLKKNTLTTLCIYAKADIGVNYLGLKIKEYPTKIVRQIQAAKMLSLQTLRYIFFISSSFLLSIHQAGPELQRMAPALLTGKIRGNLYKMQLRDKINTGNCHRVVKCVKHS